MDEDWTDEIDINWAASITASETAFREFNQQVDQGWYAVRGVGEYDRKNNDMIDWCQSNVGKFTNFASNWAFEREEDAVAFTLRWK